MAAPTIPPRPSRSQQDGPSPVTSDTPLIPPRPLRKTDPSPDREAYTRSPLNTLPGGNSSKPHTVSNRSSQELPRRPPSVSLPSIGQEGSEYSSYDQLPEEAHGVAESTASDLTTSVSADLPIHQPRASLPQSTAKRQIQTVTRTDSAQAAAAGIGKGPSTDDLHAGIGSDTGSPLGRTTSHTQSYLHSHHQHPYSSKRAPSTERHPLRAKSSFNRSTSSLTPLERTTSRPSSVYGDDFEHGIPEIGQQIPLNPMAGDVQAPSPGPTQSQHAPGIGFFNDGSARAQARRKGSRQEFGPPGSYGMHHDQEHQDQFERAWAAKHPEEAEKEGHYMDLPRPASALSSAQLNMLVGQSSGVGVGTSKAAIGTPDEETAFEASNEYMTRLGSPQASPRVSTTDATKRFSSGSQAPASPFRKTNFSDAGQSEDEQAYHLAPPSRKTNKVTGGGEADARMDLGPHASQEGGWINEHRDGAPILASDEILKRPGSAYMHAAVTPEHHFDEYDSDHGYQSRRGSLQPSSRPSSRPSSVHGGYHGGPLHRYVSHEEPHHSGVHTPLAEIEEYEPLFPENEAGDEKPRAFKKRPELALHHFPSQDVWEDTPASLQYSTTVSTPDLERKQEALEAETVAATFETPAEEQRRRSQNLDGMTSDKKTFAKPHFKPGVLEDLQNERPGVQRFPSSDVWEDTPDSMRLETTVSGPQMDDLRSPPEQHLAPGAVPADDDEVRASSGAAGIARPHIPSRPERKTKLDQESKLGADDVRAREVPDLGASSRSKPSIPARPVRPARADQMDEEAAAAAAASAAAPIAKTKPAVPARPGGEKIAALKAGFMTDLNNRLKLGPQAPPPKKEVEPEAEEESQKAPLADARKSRARGPARRKPGPPPVTELKSSTFALSPLVTVWSIDEEDELQVQPKEKAEEEEKNKRPSIQETEQVFAANEAANTSEPAFAAPKDTVAAAGAEGDVPEPSISAAAVEKQQAIEPALEASLQRSEGAPESFEAREQSDLASAETQPTTMATASSGDQE